MVNFFQDVGFVTQKKTGARVRILQIVFESFCRRFNKVHSGVNKAGLVSFGRSVRSVWVTYWQSCSGRHFVDIWIACYAVSILCRVESRLQRGVIIWGGVLGGQK